jgi:hypothetical protein
MLKEKFSVLQNFNKGCATGYIAWNDLVNV